MVVVKKDSVPSRSTLFLWWDCDRAALNGVSNLLGVNGRVVTPGEPTVRYQHQSTTKWLATSTASLDDAEIYLNLLKSAKIKTSKIKQYHIILLLISSNRFQSMQLSSHISHLNLILRNGWEPYSQIDWACLALELMLGISSRGVTGESVL